MKITVSKRKMKDAVIIPPNSSYLVKSYLLGTYVLIGNNEQFPVYIKGGQF